MMLTKDKIVYPFLKETHALNVYFPKRYFTLTLEMFIIASFI